MLASVACRMLATYFRRYDGRFKKIDLHSNSICTRAAIGLCAEHGMVPALNRTAEGRWQCWCGDTVVLKSEADRIAAREAPLSMAGDPTWRC